MKKIEFNFGFKLVLVAVFISSLGLTGVRAQPTVATQPGIGFLTPQQQSVETGPILDVVPYVLTDGYTINLSLIPSDTEFAGYANPSIPNFNTAGGQVGGLNAVLVPSVYPSFTVRQVVTTVNVWDNQTVVLGGLVSSQVQSTKDKVPVIGDMPLVGRLFQSASKQTSKKNLMIFVTATIVDPAGLRVHSDDELPFSQTSFPAQPPGALQPVEKDSVIRTAPVTQ